MYRIETVKIREKTEAFNIHLNSSREVYEAFRFISDRPQESLYVRGGLVCLDSLKQFLSDKLLGLIPLPAF